MRKKWDKKHCSICILKIKYPVKHIGGFLTILKHLNTWKTQGYVNRKGDQIARKGAICQGIENAFKVIFL